MKERGKGNGGMGQMRRGIWGVVAEGGHCWCWNQKLEVKSCENKSNLHHCSTELSTAFHLPPPPLPTNPPCHSTALKWKTASRAVRRKRYITSAHCLFTLILIPLFLLSPSRFKPSSLTPFPTLSHHNPSVFFYLLFVLPFRPI